MALFLNYCIPCATKGIDCPYHDKKQPKTSVVDETSANVELNEAAAAPPAYSYNDCSLSTRAIQQLDGATNRNMRINPENFAHVSTVSALGANTPTGPMSPVLRLIASPPIFSRPGSTTIEPFLPVKTSQDGHDYLLQVSDAIRQELKQEVFPMSYIPVLDQLIDELQQGTVSIETIASTRLDKIVEEILQHVNQNFLLQDPAFQKIMRKAAALHTQWLETFSEQYHTMDVERLKIMRSSGCLRDMKMTKDSSNTQWWEAKKIKVFTEQEANEGFAPGAWFIDIQCAVRDGIVGHAKAFTRAPNGKPVALSLLSGMEIKGAQPGEWIYVIESAECAFQSARLTAIGSVVRLLRGHKLKSERAPKGGVRYDGLYKIESWGLISLKLHDGGPDIYRSTLTLVETPGQMSMKALDKIPVPSQLDGWVIYNRVLVKEKLSQEGGAAYKAYVEAEVCHKLAQRVFVEYMKSFGNRAYQTLQDTSQRLDADSRLSLRAPV